MPFYWSLKSIPELADLSAAERTRLWKQVEPFMKLKDWLLLIELMSLGVLWSCWLSLPVVVPIGFPISLVYWSLSLWPLIWFTGLVEFQFKVHCLRPLLRTKLSLCAVCGYSLIGNVSGVCPECGTPRQAPETISSGRAG